MLDHLTRMWSLAANGQAKGVLFFVALYTSILGSYSVIRQLWTRRWPHTTGRLRESTLRLFHTHTSISDREFVAAVKYDYRVDGQEYTGNRLSPWVIVASTNAVGVLRRQLAGIDQLADGSVRVYYNPSNPAKSYLVRPGWMGILVTGAVAAAPWLAFFLSQGG